MADPISTADVQKLAKLSRLALTPEDAQIAQAALGSVLGYVERLRALDLTGTEPLTHPGEPTGRLDEDVPGPTLPNAALMAMAPEKDPPFVRVPKVLGEGGGA